MVKYETSITNNRLSNAPAFKFNSLLLVNNLNACFISIGIFTLNCL